jgi:uncharacterized protein
MDLVRLVAHKAPAVEAPIFVEGLPGIGNVGKLAAQQVVDTSAATLWYDIFSHDFPPQVTVQPDGTVRLVRCQLWVVPGKKKEPDLVVMTGDYQPLSSAGQYAMVEAVLAKLAEVGCKTLYTLGGYGLGAPVDGPEVLGAATDTRMVARLREAGAKFQEDEPGGGIVGASGLFLGLGKEVGMSGACLMGETSGYMVDPKAARAVLQVLAKLLGRAIDTDSLEERAKEIDRLAHQLHEAEKAAHEPGDLHYIG